MEELQQTNTQLVDQNTLLKAQLSTGAAQVTNIIHEVHPVQAPSEVRVINCTIATNYIHV